MQIVAKGNYPNKSQTKVSDVAVYQNDGTGTKRTNVIKLPPVSGVRYSMQKSASVSVTRSVKGITGSHFVEKSAARHREWHNILRKGIGRFLDGKESELSSIGKIIARDITNGCDRIDTTRLKYSFVSRVLVGY